MKISENCYAILGLGCYPPWVVNAGFITGRNQTLVVDSSASYLTAQTIYSYAKCANPENEILLVNTEKHLDHLGGNCLFTEKGIEIFGQELTKRKEEDLSGDADYYNSCIREKVRREAREEKVFYQKTRIVSPSNSVKDNHLFNLGEIEAKVIFTPGHTETNISIYVPSEKIIFTGDAVVQGYIPNLENSNSDGWKEWLESLDKISSLDLNALVPGHGNVLFGNEISSEIYRIRDILLKAIELGKAPTIDE